jgi:hypothetical protein
MGAPKWWNNKTNLEQLEAMMKAQERARQQALQRQHDQAIAAAINTAYNQFVQLPTSGMYGPPQISVAQNPLLNSYHQMYPKMIELPKEERTEVITGYRGWYVREIGAYVFLRSITQEFYWPPGKQSESDLATMVNNAGLHAYKKLDDAQEYIAYMKGPLAFGKVALWGHVLEHEIGYRAQYAYPLEIVAGPEHLRTQLRNLYGCEVSG